MLETCVRALFKIEPLGSVGRPGTEPEPGVAEAEEAKQRTGKGEKREDRVWDWNVENGMIWFERTD